MSGLSLYFEAVIQPEIDALVELTEKSLYE